MTRTKDRAGGWARWMTVVCCALLLALPGVAHAKKRKRFKTPTRSSTIRVTRNDKLVVLVNRETNSLSVLKVRKHGTTGSTSRTSAPAGSFPYRQSIST